MTELRITIDDATAEVYGAWTLKTSKTNHIIDALEDLVVEQIHAAIEQLADEEGIEFERPE